MKIVSMKCPECGAGLSIEEGMTRCFCSHCGTQILLDDESQKVRFSFDNADEAGYRFEKGRQRAQFESPGNVELAGEIQKLIDPAAKIEKYVLRSQAVNHELAEVQAKYDKANSMPVYIASYLIPGAIGMLTILSAVENKSVSAFIFGVLFAVALYFVILKGSQFYKYTLAGKIDSSNAELGKLQNSIEEIYSTTDFDIIPKAYQTPEAMSFLSRVLSSGRALNMNQAALLYEDHLKNESDRQFQQRQIELQQQQLEELRSSKNSAKPSKQSKESSPSAIETAAVVGGALYAGAKFLKELNKRR